MVIAFFSLLSRLVGLLRDRIFASSFGAGAELDVYYAAFRIPDFLFNLLILGTLSAAFIPVFAYYRERDKEVGWRFAGTVLNLTLLIMGALSLVIFAAAPFLVRLIFPGFDSEKLAQTANLTRIMLLSPVFFSLSSVLASVLNTFKRFTLVAVLPVVYNLSIIFGTLALYPFFGLSGLAFGVVIGSILYFVLQLPAVYQLGFRWRAVLDLDLPAVKKMAKLFFPRIFSMDLSPLIAVSIGSTLTVGSIAVYNLASNLQAVPLGVIAVSLSTVAFPLLSEAVAKGERESFRRIFNHNLTQILFLMIPLSAFILILRAQIVRLVLGTGRFGWEDTIATIAALGFFVLSLAAQGLIPLFSRAFYSLHNTKIPLVTGLISAAVYLLAAWLLAVRAELGVAGLALAFTVSSFVNLAILFAALEIKFGNLVDRHLVFKLEKILTATLCAGIATYGTLFLVAPLVDTRTVVGLGLQTLCALTVGIGVYLLAGVILNLAESRHFLSTLKSLLIKLRASFARFPEELLS